MATVPAIVGAARLGNFRLGYQPAALAAVRATRVRIFLAGVESRSRVRMAGFTIHDALNEAPNTCTFTVDGSAPTVAQTVRVTINSDTPRLLFNGAIQTVELSYEGRPANWAWSCQATDDLALLDRRRPFGTWTNTSATTIAQSLIASFAPGFTANHVQASLPAISINLDGTEGFSGALRQITQLIGGYFYVEDLDLHLFLTEAADTPNPIQTGYPFADVPSISKSTDMSQLRTRVYGKGHGEPTLSDVAVAETIVPIADAVQFSSVGGQAISLTDVITYTGRHSGGAGSLVGPSAAPSVAPTLAITGGGSIDTGSHDYAYVFGTAAGKSLPGPIASITTSLTALAAPVNAPVMNNSGLFGPGGLTAGQTYKWLVTYLTDATHETTAGPASTGVVATTNAVGLQIAAPPAGVVGLAVYRTVGNGSTYYLEQGFSVVANFSPPGSGSYTGVGIMSDATLVSQPNPPGANTATAATVNVSAIAIGPTGTTYRELHRTAVGSAQLKLVTTIANNTGTTYTDTLADSGLGANAPSSDTSGLSTASGHVNAGSTSLLTAGAAPFSASGGWVGIGQQTIRYTGLTGNTLTGIPATGIGALISTVSYGEHVDPLPALTGVTGLAVAIPKGQAVNIWVQRDDVSAQAAQAALEGGTSDGIYEYYLADERRGIGSLTTLCDAHLELFSSPTVTVAYATRDVATKSGKTIVVNLSSPPISETLTIQDVQIDAIDVSPGTAPKFTVAASSVRFSLESILRRMSALLES